MARDERKIQVVAGISVIAGVAALILLIASARFLPGVGGEFFGRILGVISTPFLMEASFLVLGFVLVMTINLWRQRREGDEFVELDVAVGTQEPAAHVEATHVQKTPGEARD